MIQLLCVHAVAAVVAPLLFRLLGRKAFALLALVPASAFMVALWSLATLLCAAAANYGQMLAGRLMVGVGEAATRRLV